MRWPHEPRFPYRAWCALAVCLVSCLAAAAIARPWSLNVLMLPVAMFTGYASGYFFGQILMRLLALVPTLGKWFVLLGFYAAGVTALVLLAAYALGHYSYPATTNYARAVEVAYLPSAYVGYAGAAIVASRRFLRAT